MKTDQNLTPKGVELLASLSARVEHLQAALRDCVTSPDAACFRDDDRDLLIRRLRAINDTARDALKAVRKLA